MAKVECRDVHTVRKRLADGTERLYHYHRKTRKAIKGEPGTPEFLQSYLEAGRAKPAAVADETFDGLIVRFKQSSAYKPLSLQTKKAYNRYLESLRREFGTYPVKGLDDPRSRKKLKAWRDRWIETPRAYDYAWSVVKLLLYWAVDEGEIAFNPAARGGRLYESDRADKVWLPEQMAAFCKTAPIELQEALFLAAYTGQRQGDLLALKWNQIKPDDTGRWWITIRQGKSRKRKGPGKLVHIPVHKDLQRVLEGMIRRLGAVWPTGPVLRTRTGQPWKSDHFGHEWRKYTARAGLSLFVFDDGQEDGLHFHDLRGTAVSNLEDAGCTEAQIAAITGHGRETVARILKHYSRRTRAVALAAILKLEARG